MRPSDPMNEGNTKNRTMRDANVMLFDFVLTFAFSLRSCSSCDNLESEFLSIESVELILMLFG
jgi:hypothetical protein